MFNNLIESNSHGRELRRRGTFVFFTTISYALLFAIFGVISIHAYDAHLENQNLEISILRFAPVLPEPTGPPDPAPTGPHNPTALRPTRPILLDTTNNPLNTPREVGVVASPIPPAPRNAVVGLTVTDPPGSGQAGSTQGSGSNNDGAGFVRDLDPPPPAARVTPAPVPRVIRSSTVLNSKALSLPKPPYPAMAKIMKVQGIVSVQVFIDESGKVISAKAVSGHAALVRAAEQAALQAVFSPTRIGDQAVKVSGTITYNFVLQP